MSLDRSAMRLAVQTNGVWGYVDGNGEDVISPSFAKAGPFAEGRAVVAVGDNAAIIDGAGDFLTPPDLDVGLGAFAKPVFQNGLAAVARKGRYGVLDLSGGWVVEPAYDVVGRFSEGRAIVRQGGKHGVIDREGNVIAPLVWDGMDWAYHEGLIWVMRELPGSRETDDGGVLLDWRRGYLDLNGTVAIPIDFSEAGEFSEGVAPVANWRQRPRVSSGGGRFGFIDQRGCLAIDFRFDWAFPFKDGLAIVKDKQDDAEKFGAVNHAGELVVEPCEALGSSCGEGRWGWTGADDLHGFVDERGDVVVEPIYSRLGNFSEGLALAGKGGEREGYELVGAKCGFIDPQGAVVIPFEYDGAQGFRDGLAAVKRGDAWGVIDRTGEVVIDFRYDRVKWTR